MRILRALGEAASSQPSTRNLDLLGPLTEAEKRVKENWPDAKPSGDGVHYLDQIMKIVAARLRWRHWIATGGEIVWLLGKVVALVFAIAIAWTQFLT